LFVTDTNHNIVHLLSAAIFLWVGYAAPSKAASVMKIFGVVYLLVAIIGFVNVPDEGSLLGLMLTNHADHYLHVALGVVILLAGIRASKSPMVAQTI
jgi:hypothetical protein